MSDDGAWIVVDTTSSDADIPPYYIWLVECDTKETVQ